MGVDENGWASSQPLRQQPWLSGVLSWQAGKRDGSWVEQVLPISRETSYMFPTQRDEGHLILSPDVRHLPPAPPPRTPPAGPGAAGTLRYPALSLPPALSLFPFSFSLFPPLFTCAGACVCVRICGVEGVLSCRYERKLTTPFRVPAFLMAPPRRGWAHGRCREPDRLFAWPKYMRCRDRSVFPATVHAFTTTYVDSR